MTKLSVAKVAPRDGRECVHCGATEGLSIQHRANKGMGGDPTKERLSNGVILCAVYNAILEQDADEADRALRMGWKCSKWDDTTQVPYWHRPSQTWRLADDEGGFEVAPREVVVAHLERYILAA